MRVENYLIAILIFSVVITVGAKITVETANNYNVDNNTRLDAIRASIPQVEDERADLQDKVTGTLDPDLATEDGIFKGAYKALKSSVRAGKLAANVTEEAASEITVIDPIITNTIKSILGILLFSFVLYMVFRFKPR